MSVDANNGLTAIIKTIPYPSQITGIDVQEHGRFLYFTWRGIRLKITAYTRQDGTEAWGLDEVEGHLLVGSNIAMLIEYLACSEKRTPTTEPSD